MRVPVRVVMAVNRSMEERWTRIKRPVLRISLKQTYVRMMSREPQIDRTHVEPTKDFRRVLSK